MKHLFLALAVIGMVGYSWGQNPVTTGGEACLATADNPCCHTIDLNTGKCLERPKKPAGQKKAKPDTSGVISIGTNNCRKVPAGDGCNTCTVCDNGSSSCTLGMCMKEPFIINSQSDPPPNPEYVPAVQLSDIFCRSQIEIVLDAERYPESDLDCLDGGRSWRRQRFICADGERILEHSFNGQKHWCRRVNP